MISKWESEFVLCVMCESFLFFIFDSLDLLNARESRRYRSQVRCRITTNKSPVFDPKALSSSFTIFRRLQQTLLDMLSRSTLLVTCYWLHRSYLCLLFKERISYDICFIFYRSRALSFRFYHFQDNVLLNLYFS